MFEVGVLLKFKAMMIRNLIILFFVFQQLNILSQQAPPILQWVNQNEHLHLKKCIDTLDFAIQKTKENKQYELTSKYLQKQSHLFLTRLKSFEKCMYYIEQIKDLTDESEKQEFLIDYYNQLGVTFYHEQLDMKKSLEN
jgi:hypothetical protein